MVRLSGLGVVGRLSGLGYSSTDGMFGDSSDLGLPFPSTSQSAVHNGPLCPYASSPTYTGICSMHPKINFSYHTLGARRHVGPDNLILLLYISQSRSRPHPIYRTTLNGTVFVACHFCTMYILGMHVDCRVLVYSYCRANRNVLTGCIYTYICTIV